MNKERLKGITMGFILCAILSMSVIVVASPRITWRVADLAFSDYKVIVDGVPFQAIDQHGNVMELFNMDGWIYAPFEHIAHAIGKPAHWDGETQTLYLGNRYAGQRVPLSQAAPFFDSGGGGNARVRAEGTVTMGGRTYNDALTYWRSGSNTSGRTVTPFSLHNLDRQFHTLSGYVGRLDGTNIDGTATMTIHGDGRLLATYEVQAQNLPMPISVFVVGVQQLRIEFTFNLSVGYFGVDSMTYALSAFLE